MPVQRVYCRKEDTVLGKRHYQREGHSLQQAGNGKNEKAAMGGKSRGS